MFSPNYLYRMDFCILITSPTKSFILACIIFLLSSFMYSKYKDKKKYLLSRGRYTSKKIRRAMTTVPNIVYGILIILCLLFFGVEITFP